MTTKVCANCGDPHVWTRDNDLCVECQRKLAEFKLKWGWEVAESIRHGRKLDDPPSEGPEFKGFLAELADGWMPIGKSNLRSKGFVIIICEKSNENWPRLDNEVSRGMFAIHKRKFLRIRLTLPS